MILDWNVAGDYPQVDRAGHIHPNAALIGKVRVRGSVFVGPQAVIRADEPGPEGIVEPIVIEENANIQDGVVVHAVGGTGVRIGSGTSIAHGAVVHGPCEIGAGCLVGFNSVLFRATLADGVVVMHQSFVEGVDIPEGLYVPSMTAVCCEEDVRALGRVPPEVAAFVEKVRQANMSFVEAWRKRGVEN